MTEMREVLINNRWPLKLPEHRAARPQWTTPPYWEAERLAHMYEHIKPGDVIYDVGAEEGDLPALWASWGADVVLFEPNPLVWPNIKAIWEANKLSPPWGCFVGFAGNEERQPNRPLDGTGWILGTWPQCADGAVIGNHGFCNLMERPDIPATTVDNTPIVPTALTIDTEGSELYVLQGAEQTLREHGPKVWVSSHPVFQREMYGYGETHLLAFIDYVGYRYELIAEDHERHFFAEPK